MIEGEVGMCKRRGGEERHKALDIWIHRARKEIIWIVQVLSEGKLGCIPASEKRLSKTGQARNVLGRDLSFK
jgi:hypothetical protein